jgi:gamma-glutamylcyclotransferase (GGCT)/AIG2-like uncharacterized protein YtfP
MAAKTKKKVSYNDINITEDLAKRFNFNTPDYLQRKQEHTIPIFVYDDLKIGGERHFMLHGMPYLGEARTVMDCFQMEQCSHTGTPMIKKLDAATKKTPMGSVHGECFVVDPIMLCELDKLMSNTKMFVRTLHWIWLEEQPNPLGKKIKQSLKVWMYLRNPGFWNDRPTLARVPKEKNGKRIYEWPLYKKPDWNDEIPWTM